MSRGLAGVIWAAAPDIAHDEPHGVVYVANFAANRIDVVSLANHKTGNSISVAPYPGWLLALPPDRHLLLIAHCGNFKAPSSLVKRSDPVRCGSRRKTDVLCQAAPVLRGLCTNVKGPQVSGGSGGLANVPRPRPGLQASSRKSSISVIMQASPKWNRRLR